MIPTSKFAALAALLLLGACQSPTEQWEPAAATKTNRVELVRLAHVVHFTSGATSLSPGETQSLSDFLASADLLGDDAVTLESAPADRLSAARRAAIKQVMGPHGSHAVAIPAAGSAGDAVTLRVDRYVVTPPNCPNWNKPAGGDPTNTPMSNFGCANTTNLGMMIANPRDLLIGRKPGPADAEPGLRAISNYRAGKAIVLPDESSSESYKSNGGGGGGAAQTGGNASDSGQ